MANSVTTKKAREKFAKAHGDGTAIPQITQVAWGDGGHDTTTRDPIQPTGDLLTVPGEFLKKNIDSISYPTTTTLRINVDLEKAEGNGYDVSSCGLYDAAGDLVAVKNFAPKAKDNETEIIIAWDEEF